MGKCFVFLPLVGLTKESEGTVEERGEIKGRNERGDLNRAN
jgi:hypothetical protein